MPTLKTARTRTVPVKHVAAFGAALATLAVGAPAADAAVVDLQLEGGVQILVPYGNTTNIAFWNDLETVGGYKVMDFFGANFRTTYTAASASKFVRGGFARASVSNTVGVSQFPNTTYSALSGIHTFGFNATQAFFGQPGWFKLDFGSGWGDPISFVEGKIETEGRTIHVGDTATVPEPATTSLLGLSLLAMGAKGVRRYRNERKQQSDSAAS